MSFSSLIRICVAGIAVVFLGCVPGCKVGPDYNGTSVRLVSPGFVNAPATWNQPNLSPVPTSMRFGDPILAGLIDHALVDSPGLRELHYRVRQSRVLVDLASGQGLPFADAGATYERRKRSSSSQPFVGPNGDAFDFFSLGVVSRWELDLVGRIARETEAATAEYQASVEEVNDFRRLLVGEIARAYIQVRLYQELQRQNELNLKVQYAALDKVKTRMEAGKVGRLDLVQLQSRLRLTESDRPLFDESLKLALTKLAILTGSPPTHALIAWVGNASQLQLPLLQHGIPANLIRHRPDMRRAEREVAAASARIGVAQSELYPRLSLLGTISVDSRELSSLISADALAYTIGPSFTWNILSLGRVEGSIEIQKMELCQAVERYQQTMLTAVSDVENSLASHQENRRRIQILQQAVNEAGEAVELASDQYDADRATLERVVSNQRRLLRASIELANARAAAATASVNLIQAIGVTWSHQPTVNVARPATTPTARPSYVDARGRHLGPNSSVNKNRTPSSELEKGVQSKSNAKGDGVSNPTKDAKPLPNRTPSGMPKQKSGGHSNTKRSEDISAEESLPIAVEELPMPSSEELLRSRMLNSNCPIKIPYPGDHSPNTVDGTDTLGLPSARLAKGDADTIKRSRPQ